MRITSCGFCARRNISSAEVETGFGLSALLPKFSWCQIRRILPEFEYRPAENQIALFVLRDCDPVGVFIAEQKPDGVACDSRLRDSRFLYSRGKSLVAIIVRSRMS